MLPMFCVIGLKFKQLLIVGVTVTKKLNNSLFNHKAS